MRHSVFGICRTWLSLLIWITQMNLIYSLNKVEWFSSHFNWFLVIDSSFATTEFYLKVRKRLLEQQSKNPARFGMNLQLLYLQSVIWCQQEKTKVEESDLSRPSCGVIDFLNKDLWRQRYDLWNNVLAHLEHAELNSANRNGFTKTYPFEMELCQFCKTKSRAQIRLIILNEFSSK